MNFFKRTTSWSVTELAFLKICLLSAGLTAGILFSDVLRAGLPALASFALLTGVICLLMWLRKMRQQ